MAKLTIADAARVTGVSRMLLYRYIKAGKLSRTPEGLIDTAELLRAGLLLQTSDVTIPVTTLHDVISAAVTAASGKFESERFCADNRVTASCDVGCAYFCSSLLLETLICGP
jgi:hypothetical protein